MKRINKLLFVLIVIGFSALSVTVQKTESTFNVPIDQELYYRIEQSSIAHDINWFLVSDPSIKSYDGFKINNVNYSVGEIVKVKVLNVTGESIEWAYSVGENTKSTTSQASASTAHFDQMFIAPDAPILNYLDPFYIQPILGNSTANWDALESFYNTLVADLDEEHASAVSIGYSYIGYYKTGSFTESSGLAKIDFEFIITYQTDISGNTITRLLRADSESHYNLTTGILEQYHIFVDFQLSAETVVTIPDFGTVSMHLNNRVIVESKVSRVAPPNDSSTSALAAFFAENKWYFVEGGVALGTLAVAIPTTVIVYRRKGVASRKTTKKKSRSKSKKRK